ncbi:MAG: hypothetical protein RIF37_16385 [Rhodospirillaceae bacterium]
MRRLSYLILSAFIWMAPAVASDVTSEVIIGCDRLAANPPDPDRVTEGVLRAEVDLPAAIMACRYAVATYPEEARFSYQLARVLFYDGQTELALASFERAIQQDYRQAKFLLGLIMTRGYAGVPQDICRVEQLWRAAAQQNHANAQVSYVDMAVQGRFDTCAQRVSDLAMSAFLDQAAPQLDYVGGLLIANLRQDLETNP